VPDRVVLYYRVSTARQGRSGLGLEAQRHSVEEFLRGSGMAVVAEHTEVESGTRNSRPQLQLALASCRIHRATLLVAKLDRLSRNASFLLQLRDSGVEFIAADMPGASRLTVGILAMVAENEAEAISVRTKAALAAARRRGVRLGNPAHLTHNARRKGTKASAAVRSATAVRRACDLAPIIADLQRSGARSLRSIAHGLTVQGIPTARDGSRWTATEVQRILSRIESPFM
jgi:DNA invertase Pin-like site-specific DNA recombinase